MDSRRRGFEPWKPSKVESAQGFILEVPSQALTDLSLLRKKEFAYNSKQAVQLRTVVVGDKASQIFDSIDDLRYHFKSVPEAIDWCFELFFSFDC